MCRCRDGRRRLFGLLRRCERGSVAAEFALIVTPVLMITFGIVQFGLAFSVYNTMTDAARRAARAAAVRGETAATAESLARQSLQTWTHVNFDVSATITTSGRVRVTVTAPIRDAALINPLGLMDPGTEMRSRVVLRRTPGVGGS